MNVFKESVVPLISDFVKLPGKDGLDYDGDVILYGDNFYRGITPVGANNMINLINTGVISELQNRKLIPQTKVVPLELPGYVFMFQHEKIKNVSYVSEWSFSMLQDAALMALNIFELLVSRGFNSKDGHPYNILFNNNRPVWVDLTSFIARKPGDYWAVAEFFYRIFQPLEIMSANPALARERLKNMYRNSYQTNFYLNLATKFGVKKQQRFPAVLRRCTRLFQRYSLEMNKEQIFCGIETMRQKIRKLKLHYHSDWSMYHNNWIDGNKNVVLSRGTLRFLKINNLISSLPIKSVVEFAANQGMFSAMLAENSAVEKIVATDNDEQAVDTMYKLLSENRLSNNCVRKIFPMIIDFRDSENLFERINGDAAVALAMTHHLLLSQHIKIENMFRRFSRFTKRFLFVEFMPLGLWDGVHEPPPLPPWYTEEYFAENMEKYFRILMKMQLDKNRVLFVGELKNRCD